MDYLVNGLPADDRDALAPAYFDTATARLEALKRVSALLRKFQKDALEALLDLGSST